MVTTPSMLHLHNMLTTLLAGRVQTDKWRSITSRHHIRAYMEYLGLLLYRGHHLQRSLVRCLCHPPSRTRNPEREMIILTRRCYSVDKWRTQQRASWRHRHRVRPRGSQRKNRGIWKISALSAPKIETILRRYVTYSKSRCSRDQTLSFAVSIYTFIIRSEGLSAS